MSFSSHRYKNLSLLLLSGLMVFLLYRLSLFHSFLIGLGQFRYLGAFLGGLLFVSTFTASLGTLILLALTEYFNVFEISLMAGLGAVVGDLTIFRFIRSSGLIAEIKHLFEFWRAGKIDHLLHTKYFAWTLPVLGALIIASPLPDELGISLLGISKMKTEKFIIVSFLLNSTGIWLILSTATWLKH